MTHELKDIIREAFSCFNKGEKCVLATVVALDGTSYRKPGVRMLITQSGKMVGAVSGGCVEKDVQQRAQSVFNNGKPLLMAYDARFRLGCDGTLYLLIEPFTVNENTYTVFQNHLRKRQPIELNSYFKKEDNATGAFGTIMQLNEQVFNFNTKTSIDLQLQAFKSKLSSCFKLLLIGAEHDAVKLNSLAVNMGWEVVVVSTWRDPKTKADFTGAEEVWSITPDMLDIAKIDNQTAVVLMTHNYALDLKYLIHLHKAEFAYLGVLGSRHRNDQLRMELFDHLQNETEFYFYGPIGLDIGAETPEEIAISIIAEILSVTRNRQQKSLSHHYNITSA